MRNWPETITDQTWSVSAYMVRRELLELAGRYRTDLLRDEDWEMDTRLKAFGKSAVFVDDILVTIRQHGGPQLTKQLEDYASIRERSLAIVIETLQNLPVDTRRSQDVCAWEMFLNALRFYTQGDHNGYLRCLRTAVAWSGKLQRMLIEAASLTGPRPFMAAKSIKRHVRRAVVVTVRFAARPFRTPKAD
jgi:hypothetical protein